jgi:uncharacterized membrane protein
MKSRLQVRGHPIHAMAVAMPIGLYSSALICDMIYLLLQDPFWFRMAYWIIVFGLVGHVGAAVTGLPDFLAIRRERGDAQRAATTHLLFGVGLLIIQVLNLVVRNVGTVPPSGSVGLPVLVNVLGVGLLGFQGWFGGELVYRHLVGVEVPVPPPAEATGKHHKDKKHH